MTALPAIEGAAFQSTIEVVEQQASIRMSGTGDLRVVRELAAQLGAVHEHARAQGLNRVIVDLTEVEFMNSSCLKCFATWLAGIGDLPDGERYRVRFRWNPEFFWQRRSVRALKGIAITLVSVDP